MRYFLLLAAMLLSISCNGPLPISSVDGVNPPGLAHELKTYAPTGSLTRGLDAPALLEDDEQINEVMRQLQDTLLEIIHDISVYDTLPISATEEYRIFSTGRINFAGFFSHQVTRNNWYYSNADLACALNDFTTDDSLFFGGGLHVELATRCCPECYVSYDHDATINGSLRMGGLYSGKVTLNEVKLRGAGYPGFLMEGTLFLESDSLEITLALSHNFRWEKIEN